MIYFVLIPTSYRTRPKQRGETGTRLLATKGSQRLMEENMPAFVPPGLDFACQVLGCIVTQQTLCRLRYYKVKFWYVKCEVEDICLVTWIIEEKA